MARSTTSKAFEKRVEESFWGGAKGISAGRQHVSTRHVLGSQLGPKAHPPAREREHAAKTASGTTAVDVVDHGRAVDQRTVCTRLCLQDALVARLALFDIDDPQG